MVRAPVVGLLLIVLLVGGCGEAPASSLDPLGQATAPSAPVGGSAPAPMSASAPSEATIQYRVGGLSFDYPADWNVLGQTVDEHYVELGPAFGIGTWTVPCSRTSTSVDCAPPVSTVPAGGVVVELRAFSPPLAVAPTAPPGGILLADGIVAVDSETPTFSTWQLYVPTVTTSQNTTVIPPTFTISASYVAPDIEVHRAEVLAMVHSVRWSGSP